MLILVIILMTGTMFYSILSKRFNWVSYVMTFLLGAQDAIFNMHVMKILGTEFTTKSE